MILQVSLSEGGFGLVPSELLCLQQSIKETQKTAYEVQLNYRQLSQSRSTKKF